MKSSLISSLILLLSFSLAAGKDSPLDEAHRSRLRGDYEKAREKYTELAKDDKTRAEATLGISRCLQREGEYDKALETVASFLKAKPKDARMLARQGELLYLRGRWVEAEKAADAALKENKDQLLARWVRGQVYRDRGDVKKADAEFRILVRFYNDNDVSDPEDLLVIGLAGSENARWNKLADQFETILQDIYGDALKANKDFWPAEYEAGMLLLEKYNRREGLAALEKVLKINPYASEALVGKGIAALQRLEIKQAERFAEQALKYNPNLPAALHLRADVHYAVGALDKALDELKQARKINPRDEQTLGRIAACLWVQRKNKELDALVAEVGKHNPTPGLFHLVLADRLEDRRHFGESEKHFKKALELRPVLHLATTNLGMLYMRMGKEKEAADLLDRSFKADPFNIRVSNMRKVLRHLDRYETIKTEHFELRFDPKTDSALGHYLADFLEKVHAELADKFKHKPKGLILVEVFNNHEMFSGRTIALPDLHTIGACTGRMVAMVSPRGRGVDKPFNWARVMRHEIVHIFNLDQTNFLVPHWFTEGLAVSYEGTGRPQIWNQLLRARVPSGKLLTLDTIDLGFIRPRDPLEWSLAYCQAELYVEYLEKTHGKAAIGEMLNAFRDGLGTAAAIQKVCKVDKETFEKGYRKHLEEVVKKLGGGKPGEKPMSFDELKAAHKKDPDDLDVAGRLAVELLDHDRAEARKLAQRVLDRKAKHPKASYVLARLAVLGGDGDRARTLLEAAVDRESPDPDVVRTLGRMYYDANEFKKAAQLFELGRKAEPYDNRWLTLLARAHARAEDIDRLIEVLRELVKNDADNLDARRRLARLLSPKNPADAEQYARAALEIDIGDKEARELLYKALEDQKKNAELERMRKILEK